MKEKEDEKKELKGKDTKEKEQTNRSVIKQNDFKFYVRNFRSLM